MKTPRRCLLKDESGLATLEAIPLLVIFVMFVSFAMGYFGIVHTAILHSIAARTYAFETFRNRTNLVYFRENSPASESGAEHYADREMRLHGIQPEKNLASRYPNMTGTARPISIGKSLEPIKASLLDHNQKVYKLEPRNKDVAFNPVWIKVAYGICLTARCGEE